MTASSIERKICSLEDPARALFLQRFFKTGPGEYAEGDKFLGLGVPQIRALTREYRELEFDETIKLLHSPYHETRMLALYILVWQFKKGDEAKKKKICNAYLKNTRFINNWDLVDTTAEHIVGAYFFDRDHAVLQKLALSPSLWKKRIAMLSCAHFIRRNDFGTALQIAKLLINDEHDLIHKAVGWMLREIGKRDLKTERKFLDQHYKKMPRTMLRYAIEKFHPSLRQKYLKGKL